MWICEYQQWSKNEMLLFKTQALLLFYDGLYTNVMRVQEWICKRDKDLIIQEHVKKGNLYD
jgi:hypothetical protein